MVSGCSRENGYGSDSPTPSPAAACSVTDSDIRQWIDNPSIPPEPAGVEDACFYNYAWQELFAVTQREAGGPQFASWPNDQELFTPAGKEPTPWKIGTRPLHARPLRKGLGMPGAGGVVADQVTEAAALTPLVDQKGRWAHYSVVINKFEYEYIRCCELYQGDCFNAMGGVDLTPPVSKIALPSGSVELKLAWRMLEDEDPSRYLTVEGEVELVSPSDPSKPVKTQHAKLALVGMHIVTKTPQHPGSLWATFEHVDNAPDCSKQGGSPSSLPPGSSGWSFYDPNCKPTSDYPDRCQDNWYCLPCPIKVEPDVAAAFNANPRHTWKIPADGVITCTPLPHEFNQPVTVSGKEVWIHLFDPGTCKKPPIPSQTCRTVPISDEVKALNDQVRKVLGGINGLSAVLANYELVGVLWFDDQKKLQPANDTTLANTTMETYLQDPTLMPTGCVLCHTDQGESSSVTRVPKAPPMEYNSGLADRSMVFQQIRQFGDASKCSAEQAAKCSAWQAGCPAGR